MTDSNTGGEATILEERRRKLEELRAENKAYINDFVPYQLNLFDTKVNVFRAAAYR